MVMLPGADEICSPKHLEHTSLGKDEVDCFWLCGPQTYLLSGMGKGAFKASIQGVCSSGKACAGCGCRNTLRTSSHLSSSLIMQPSMKFRQWSPVTCWCFLSKSSACSGQEKWFLQSPAMPFLMNGLFSIIS
ncbi:Hypothetical predicted protein [Podarcis lilfordi]|uniref:Uncharacterized protein n=1 Tax=Podarcis lilfordi TaxID=74358 RepID=A0AA35LLP0_9SAUR|nr:Hypothetical predicted protein [Podarcis lilfordi]